MATACVISASVGVIATVTAPVEEHESIMGPDISDTDCDKHLLQVPGLEIASPDEDNGEENFEDE